ncbi:MAG: serine/threonine-protein phosphatase [Geobacter sp.]|nr:serine/threonine-protein phosphatase [Geobacter sp.]
MKSAWGSDTGKVRENNEDSVMVDDERGLFLLADGMGGLRAGEVASALAVRTVHEWLVEHHLTQAAEMDIAPLLNNAALEAHKAILADAAANPEHAGMGTTLEIVTVREGWAFMSHVGDSRVYHMRERLRQVTRDHNMAGRLRAQGVAEEMINPYFRHILTQALGGVEELTPDIEIIDLRGGDILLLCSDGLNEMLDDGEIGEILRDRSDITSAVHSLIDKALAAGGVDNVSAVLVEV